MYLRIVTQPSLITQLVPSPDLFRRYCHVTPCAYSFNSCCRDLMLRSLLVPRSRHDWFVNTLIYIVFSGPRNYVKTIWAILLSYGIILFKAHGIPQFATITPYLQRVMVDENTQYLLLACIWWTTKPIWVVLLPYATFSVFHAANYIRTELLPTAIPATSPLHSLSSTRLIPALTYFTQTYQASCLKAVSYLEVFFILPYLIVFVFTGRVSLFTPVIFVQFLRFRYQFSPMTREAFAELKRRADAVFLGGAYQGYYLQAVDMIERYGNVAQQQAASERRTQ
ncbi:hypothetical protein BC830DRAFT_1165842 [Chytriomyces sp. MP71]|nr:hypothetical protein BC830DRAFT_1165842 [Chytriomyces sp. MP71]